MPVNSAEQIKNLQWYSLALPRWYQILIWISFITVLLICFLDPAGWIFNITPFKSISSDWESMKLITSVCLTGKANNYVKRNLTGKIEINYSK